MNRLAAALFLPTLAGCTQDLQAIRPQDVLAHPAANEGKRVVIRGYLRYGTDARGLWQSKQAYRSFTLEAPQACLTLFNASRFAKQLHARDGSQVRLTARVQTIHLKPDEIALGWCNDTGLMIEKVG